MRTSARTPLRALALALAILLALFQGREANAGWSAWESLGGTILEQPSCVGWDEANIQCFGRGPNAWVWAWWRQNTPSWLGPQSLYGILPSRPDCTSWGFNRIDCFTHGMDDGLWHNAMNGVRWSGWQRLDSFPRLTQQQAGCSEALTGERERRGVSLCALVLPPECVSPAYAVIDCVAVVSGSTEYGAVAHVRYDDTGQAPDRVWGDVTVEDSPVRPADAPECVPLGDAVTCILLGANGSLWAFAPGTEHWGWEEIFAGGGVYPPRPECLEHDGTIHCVFSTDNAMFDVWREGTGWQVSRVTLSVAVGGLSCVSRPVTGGPVVVTHQLHCVGESSGAFVHYSWDGSLRARPGRVLTPASVVFGLAVRSRPECLGIGSAIACFVRDDAQTLHHIRWTP